MQQKMSLIQTLKKTQCLTISNDYWDNRLTESEKNPFPLAPKNLVDRSLVTSKSYRKENDAWGKFVSDIMTKEHFLTSVCILGAGLARDLGWVLIKIKQWANAQPKCRSTITIADSSKVALDNAKSFLKKHSFHRKIKVVHTEILDGWENGNIDDEEIGAYFLSQFIEHQEDNMAEFMHHFGRFLKLRNRAIYMVTAILDDNDKDQILWDHAKLFTYQQLIDELEEGLGDTAKVEILGKHKYFDRTYTFFKFQA